MTVELTSVEACVDAVIAKVGKDLRIGAPLAAGKPNQLLNAFYQRAVADPSIQLTLLTALTLEKPKGKSDLERRFLGPMVERVFADYPDLDYELARTRDELPPNVRVIEFYFPPGKFLKNPAAQRDYISTNYTHAARDILDRGVNVLAQLVAEGVVEGEPRLSLGSNPDVTPDIMPVLARQEAEGKPVAFVAQVNAYMPFMFGDAEVAPEDFHFIVKDSALDYPLFGPPKMSVSPADHAIGLYCSALVRDGGELQIGIGSLGDAVVNALLVRHQRNAVYRRALAELGVRERFGHLVDFVGGEGPFEEGLFAATEMMVDGFLHLIRSGVVKRRVYDDVILQRLLNQEILTEDVTPDTLDALHAAGRIHRVLRAEDIRFLRRFGILRQEVALEGERLRLPGGETISADLEDRAARSRLHAEGMGARLGGGAIVHSAFFLGPNDFYQALRDMSEEERRRIRMRTVRRVNQLYGHEEIDRLHRKDARFFNTGMMATLSGAVVSDGLADGRVVSGVGGQFNFVTMAHELPDGRSILQIRATRLVKGRHYSNIVPTYGHVTVPRHYRDLIVTEYGVADLRGKTDEEVVHELLAVADSRFQEELLAHAKSVGKVRADYAIPELHRHNLPERYEQVLAGLEPEGAFPPFPFGTDLTADEIRIGKALKSLARKASTRGGLLRAIYQALVRGGRGPDVAPYLARMGFETTSGLGERLYQRLLAAELRANS